MVIGCSFLEEHDWGKQTKNIEENHIGNREVITNIETLICLDHSMQC